MYSHVLLCTLATKLNDNKKNLMFVITPTFQNGFSLNRCFTVVANNSFEREIAYLLMNVVSRMTPNTKKLAVTFNNQSKINSNIGIYRKIDYFILRMTKT